MELMIKHHVDPDAALTSWNDEIAALPMIEKI